MNQEKEKCNSYCPTPPGVINYHSILIKHPRNLPQSLEIQEINNILVKLNNRFNYHLLIDQSISGTPVNN